MTTFKISKETTFSSLSAWLVSQEGKQFVKDVLVLDARSISNALETKQITCEALMGATLQRVDAVNSRCNAIILLQDKNDLLDQARAVDQCSERKSWLHGIPIAIKDISNVKGIPTTMGGSPLFMNQNDCIPTENDFFVENLLQAGAIVIGKTNSPENAVGSHTFNEKWGTTLNPFHLNKSAGGSSGGAAVALATRMLCIADGSDMMGSLRNPAGWNNVYSHRPTAGMIGGAPAMWQKSPLSYPISTAGPMARTPLDCAMLLETMAGKNVFDAAFVNGKASLEGVRIGWCADWGHQMPFENGVLPLCRQYLRRLEEGGATVVDIDEGLFDLSKLWTSWTRIRACTISYQFLQMFPEDALLGPDSLAKSELQWEIKQGLMVSDSELEEAGRIGKEFASWLDSVLDDKYDILALPSAQVFPFPSEWKWPQEINGVKMDTYHRWMEVCVPVSLGGLPCSTVPVGFGGGKQVPMGLQLFAQRNQDVKVLQVAHACYQIEDFASKVIPTEREDAILDCLG